MVRIGAAFILGFVLIIVESMIVIKLKNYSGIDLGNINLLVSVWAMNFFLVFAILTDIKIRLDNRSRNETGMNID